MSIKSYLLNKNFDSKNIKDIVNKNLKFFSPMNKTKLKLKKVNVDFNSPKDNINSNYKKSFKVNKMPMKKSLSIDSKYKLKSHKQTKKNNPIEKIFINCLNENQIKELKIDFDKDKSSTKMATLQNNLGIISNDSSPIVSINRNNNYFNTQLIKRTENHSNSLKITNNGFINSIRKKINEIKSPSKFFTNKKDNKPTVLLNSVNNGNNKLTFTSLIFNGLKNQLNPLNFDNSSIEEDKSHIKDNEEHNNNNANIIKLENNISDSSSVDNEIDDKKLIIKSDFTINKENLPVNNNKNNEGNNENNECKENKNNINDNNNENNDVFVMRKQRYGYTVQQAEVPLLQKKVILFSVKTKAGICDEVEKTNQDSYLIKENIFGEDFNLYGVFDGHGDNGHLISNYISEFLNNYYTNESNYIDNEELSSSKNTLSKIFLEYNEKIIKNCQADLDASLNTKIKFDISQSGSTCVLLFIINETLICSNIGDSQCYLFNCSEEEMWTFESLSIIHKPTDIEEQKRILKSGGEIHPYYDENGIYEGPDRVYAKNKPYPGLCLSRTIGDLEGKKIGIISDPDIVVKKIDKNMKYVVLGSDGLWDVIKPYDVSRTVRPYFNRGDIEGASKILMKKAEQLWKKNNEERDDITIIVIFIGKPNTILQKEKNIALNIENENVNINKKESTSKIPLILNLD